MILYLHNKSIILKTINCLFFIQNMKDKTKVKPKNVAKVAELKAKNPHLTQREIAEKTWIARNTIIKAEKELSQNWTKDPTILYIVDESKNRIKRVQKIFNRYLDEVEEKEKLDRADISLAKDIVKDDMARVTIFGGDVTDDQWGLIDWVNAPLEDLLKLIKK